MDVGCKISDSKCLYCCDAIKRMKVEEGIQLTFGAMFRNTPFNLFPLSTRELKETAQERFGKISWEVRPGDYRKLQQLEGFMFSAELQDLVKAKKKRKNRRPRTVFTTDQMFFLELQFSFRPYVSKKERIELAKVTNLDDNQIRVWFQNRRAKYKKISN